MDVTLHNHIYTLLHTTTMSWHNTICRKDPAFQKKKDVRDCLQKIVKPSHPEVKYNLTFNRTQINHRNDTIGKYRVKMLPSKRLF